MPPMRTVVAGQVYQDLRQRGPFPRQVKVVAVEEGRAWVRNTITERHAWVETRRLLAPYRFKLVSEVGALAPNPEAAVPA